MPITRLAKDLYTFPIPLPDSPLKWLNCYVIRPEEGRSLLVDCGFRHPVCQEALVKGMEELALDPKITDVFFTHAHADHCGNAELLMDAGCRIFMSDVDIEVFFNWDRKDKRLTIIRALKEGLPPETEASPMMGWGARRLTADTVHDGDMLTYGDYRLKCLLTPGHTPGHMCLYDEEKQVLFLGDHVLFDISPNITFYEEMDDALGSYIESLRSIRDLPVTLALPGHREQGKISVAERVDKLLRHHQRRLQKSVDAIEENPGITAWELARRLNWKIRAASWEDFPTSQKWFALGETIAHLDYLLQRGLVEYTVENRVRHYRVTREHITIEV